MVTEGKNRAGNTYNQSGNFVIGHMSGGTIQYWDEIIPDFDLQKYQQSLREQYGHLKLERLASGYAYNELKLRQMFVEQNTRDYQEFRPQVHERPKTEQLQIDNPSEAQPQEEKLKRDRKRYDQQPMRSILEVIREDRYRRLVVLGDPGSGKSSLLQYIALEWAEMEKSHLPSYPIPLLIELRTYVRNQKEGRCQSFLEFIHKCSGWVGHLNQHRLDDCLKVGQAIALFDGLDEVFDKGLQEDVMSQIHDFTVDYPGVKTIVTSRPTGYESQKFRDAGFHHVMLQDLDGEQIEDFIQRWHDRTGRDEEEPERKREYLKRAILNSSAVEELAGNPLLLTMMVMLNPDREWLRDRVKLYEKASKVLLEKWDFDRALVDVDARLDPNAINHQDKQKMLCRVAYQMQAGENGLAGNSISAQALKKCLVEYLKTLDASIQDNARTIARLLIDRLRKRNFILCSLGSEQEQYAFVHRTFLEYFCAKEIADRFEDKQLNFEPLRDDIFGQHCLNKFWHEVLRLICRMIDAKAVGKIIEFLISSEELREKKRQELLEEIDEYGFYPDWWIQYDTGNLFLASECLLEVKNRSEITHYENQLITKLKELITYSAQLEGYDAFDLEIEVCTQAVKTVARNFPNHPDTRSWLVELAKDVGFRYCDLQYSGEVQVEAVSALARGWKNDSEICQLLKDITSWDDSDFLFHTVTRIKKAAIRGLVYGWKNNPATLKFLKEFSRSTPHEDLKVVALQEIARNWQAEPETLPLIQEAISYSEASLSQHSASLLVPELITRWKNNYQIYSLLKFHFFDELNWKSFNVIENVKILIQTWEKGDLLYEILCEFASDRYFNLEKKFDLAELLGWPKKENELKNNVRFIALEAIVRYYLHDSKALELLRDRAENDPDKQLREWAQQQLQTQQL